MRDGEREKPARRSRLDLQPFIIFLTLSLHARAPSLSTIRGFNIGTRLVDEYLAKTRTTKCGGFQDAMAAAARGACRACLGVLGVLSDWSADGTEVTLSLPDNPLADGVELPSSLAAGGLWYSNLLAGALRGALAQVNLAVETTFISDPLLLPPGEGGGAAPPAAAIRVRLVSASAEAYPFKDED